MTNGSELKSKSAMALREAGYHPLPRWWVTTEQLELVAYMAKQNGTEVNRIRAEANGWKQEDDIEKAWKQHKRSEE